MAGVKISQRKQEQLLDKAVDIGGKVILVGGGILLTRKIIRDIDKRNAEREAARDPNVKQALSLQTAMNPSGEPWLRAMDGTDEKAIFATAKQITDFKKVSTAYSKLTKGRSLTSDLSSELKPEDFNAFLSLVKASNQTKLTTAQIAQLSKDQANQLAKILSSGGLFQTIDQSAVVDIVFNIRDMKAVKGFYFINTFRSLKEDLYRNLSKSNWEKVEPFVVAVNGVGSLCDKSSNRSKANFEFEVGQSVRANNPRGTAIPLYREASTKPRVVGRSVKRLEPLGKIVQRVTLKRIYPDMIALEPWYKINYRGDYVFVKQNEIVL